MRIVACPHRERISIQKTKQEHTMLKIPLNSAILSQHKSAANNVNIKYKSKYDRKQFRHTECMFLTQDGNKLIYTTCPGVYAIRNWEEVDFVLPHPLTINLSSVPYTLSEQYSWLEIPDCTMESIKTFYDASRPKYIKESDLQTNIIAINGQRANIEFINPERIIQNFEKYIKLVRTNPVTNKDQFEWFVRDNNNKIAYHDINKVHRLVFGQNNTFDFGFQNEIKEQEILHQINQLHNTANTLGIVKRTIDNGSEEKTYLFPVALFEKERQIIFWQGCAKHVK